MRSQNNPHQIPSGQNNSANQSNDGKNQNRHDDQEKKTMSLKQGKHFIVPGEELLYIKYLMSEKYKVFEAPEVMTLRKKSIAYL